MTVKNLINKFEEIEKNDKKYLNNRKFFELKKMVNQVESQTRRLQKLCLTKEQDSKLKKYQEEYNKLRNELEKYQKKITEDKEIENIKQNDNIQEQKNVDEIDEVEEITEDKVKCNYCGYEFELDKEDILKISVGDGSVYIQRKNNTIEMFDVEDYFEDEIKFIYNNKEYLLEEGDIVNKKINSLNIEFPEGVKVQEITEDKEIENIKQNDNIQEQKNVDEIDEVEEEIEEQVSKDIEQLAISLLEQQGCFEALIEKIRNGTYKIYSNKEGGVTPNKCKIITIDANGNKTPIYYFKFFSLEKPEEIDDFGKTSIEQLSLTYVTQILDSTNLNVSTCKMTAIENTEDKLHNMIITKAAENPINIESAYTHAHNFERDSPAFFEVSKAINGRKNNLLSTKECFSSENTLQAILAKHENDLDWQKNFLESMYSVLATASVFDLYDVRVDGNIMIDEKSGKWQLIDFDIEKDLTIDGNKNGLEFTPAKNRECLENRKEAQDICELCINSFSGYYFDADGFFLSIDQIITGKQVVNNEEIVYKIPEELSEFKDYKQKIAENILQISNTIDERHNELQNKQINGDELTKKEKQELIFLKERHANIMKIFEKTEIGKYTAMIYEQEKGQKIQAYTETETELSTVAIDVSKRNKRDIENDNIVCNDSKIEITQQAKRIGEQIINLNNQKQGELYAVRI